MAFGTNDKLMHAVYGAVIYLIVLATAGSTLVALAVVTTVGIGKEIYDSKHPNHTADALDAIDTITIPAIVTGMLMLMKGIY